MDKAEGDPARPNFFFHEYGRHVGGVSRSSMKGKETQLDDGEQNTSRTQTNRTKTNQTTQNKRNQGPEAVSPISQTVFPLYGGETGEKRVGSMLSKGLNSLQEPVKRISARAKSKRGHSKEAAFILKTVTTRPLRRVAKHGPVAF